MTQQQYSNEINLSNMPLERKLAGSFKTVSPRREFIETLKQELTTSPVFAMRKKQAKTMLILAISLVFGVFCVFFGIKIFRNITAPKRA